MNKKGFTLIELLAVIIILAVIALISTPVVLNVVDKAKKESNKNSVYGLIDASKLYYAESMLDESKINKVNGSINLIDEIKISGDKPDSGSIYIDNTGNIALAVVYDKVCYIKNFIENDLSETTDIENCKLDIEEIKVVYKENILNGADPEIKEGLVPVVINSDGSVKKADIYKEWYNYTNKSWANAVTLKDKTKTYLNNEVIPSENIDGYFVWIPRYKYEIFYESNYNSVINGKPATIGAKEINIVFESKNTTKSTGSTVGTWLTHPAFTTLDVNGIWVGKYETSGSTNDINVVPNVESLRNINVKTMFELAYYYNRDLDSHMMKNTEWGAVAYLSNSKYGRCNNGVCEEVRINNSSKYITGCAATTEALNYVNKEQTDHSEGYYNGCENKYNTSIGVLASTTGNITGIYDMSGGALEYLSSYINDSYGSSGFDATSIALYDNKYFDKYKSNSSDTNFSIRILGDATGEMGPFYSYKDFDGTIRPHNTWNGDSTYSLISYIPWSHRGGSCKAGVIAGIFNTSRQTGEALSNSSFRLILS